jgi:hypothetical protein
MAAPYRNDHDALMARLNGLLDELAALRARTSTLRDLERSERDVEREIADVRRKVARVAPTRLPLLDRVSIASPCKADWDSMTGDDRSRFCAECQKHVYNIASMTSEEAETILRGVAGEVCLRLYRRADGTLLTADCPVGVRRRRRRRTAASVTAGGLLAAGALLAFERSRPDAVPDPVPSAMGVVAIDPTGDPPGVDPSPQAPSADAGSAQTSAPMPLGKMRRWPVVPPEKQLDAELAKVRSLLDQRSRTKDPGQRRALEERIREASQRVVALSPPP